MAIRIEASLSKKVPIVGTDYSSQQAAISISAEVADPQQVVTEAQHLYRLAEQAVNTQLGIASIPSAETAGGNRNPSSSNPWPAPRRPAPGHRRSPPPASDSQLRLLRRLLNGDSRREQDILNHYQVGDLAQMTIAEASAAIDDLKRVTT